MTSHFQFVISFFNSPFLHFYAFTFTTQLPVIPTEDYSPDSHSHSSMPARKPLPSQSSWRVHLKHRKPTREWLRGKQNYPASCPWPTSPAVLRWQRPNPPASGILSIIN